MFDKKIVRSAIPRLEKRTARSEVSSEQGRSKSAGLDSLEGRLEPSDNALRWRSPPGLAEAQRNVGAQRAHDRIPR